MKWLLLEWLLEYEENMDVGRGLGEQKKYILLMDMWISLRKSYGLLLIAV